MTLPLNIFSDGRASAPATWRSDDRAEAGLLFGET